MASGVLAQLKVLIGADTAQLKSGLNEAQVNVEKSSRRIESSFHSLASTFSRLLGPLSATGRQVSVAIDAIGQSAAEANKSLSGLGGAIAIAGSVGTAAFLALGGVTLKLFETLDETAHAAEGVGMGVAQYTQLTEALKVYDVNQEQANQALAYFDKILSGLVRSKAGVEAIRELGLNMQALQKMSPHDALLAIADAFSKLKDGTQKAGIAAALFENTYGIKLIPFLNQGRAGIEALESKFKDLGDATAKNAAAAENLTIAWSNFKAGLESAVLEISNFARIPGVLIAIAHPLLTIKAMVLDLGVGFGELYGEILRGLQRLVDESNRILASLHLPTIGINFGSAISANQGRVSQLAAWRDAVIKAANASGEKMPSGGGIIPTLPTGGGSGRGGGGQNRVAAYLQQLHDQLVSLSQGDAARGLEHLKELGATQAQLAEGKNLLDAIQSLKDERKFAEEFERAQKSMKDMLEKLTIPKEMDEQANQLATAFGNLADKIRSAGAEAIGFKAEINGALKAQAGEAAGLGGPLGGFTPGFTPSGLGSMRFDMDKLGESAEKLGHTMSQSFTRMIEGGQNFKQMLGNLLVEFQTFLLKAILFKEIGTALSGMGGFLGVVGQFFTGLSTPGRALGGPVSAGALYRVGEHGPEYFSPAVSGTIVPMEKIQQNSRPMIFAPVYNITTPNPDSFRKSQSQIIAEGYRQAALAHARNS